MHAAEENIRAQQSLITANDANVKRLLETKKYARIEAPFDGVITYRNPTSSDVGTLISSGSATYPTTTTAEVRRPGHRCRYPEARPASPAG